MKVFVRFPAYLHAITEADSIRVELKEGAALRDLFQVLVTRYGERLIDLLHTSELNDTPLWASVTMNEQDVLVEGVRHSDFTLQDQATVVLLGPVGGG